MFGHRLICQHLERAPTPASSNRSKEIVPGSVEDLSLQLVLLSSQIAITQSILARGISKPPSLQSVIQQLGKDSIAAQLLKKGASKLRGKSGVDYTNALMLVLYEGFLQLDQQKYQKVLLKDGPFTMKSWAKDFPTVEELYRLEKDPQKIIALHLEARSWGKHDFLIILKLLTLYSGADEPLRRIKEMRAMGLDYRYILTFLESKTTMAEVEKSTVSIVDADAKNGNLAFLVNMGISWDEIRELRSKGFPDREIGKGLYMMKRAGMTHHFAYFFNLAKTLLQPFEKIASSLGQMEKVGYSDAGLQYNFIINYNADVNEFFRVAKQNLGKLIAAGISESDAKWFVTLKDCSEKTPFIIKLADLVKKVGIDSLIKFWEFEKDPEKVRAYLSKVKNWSSTMGGPLVGPADAYGVVPLSDAALLNGNSLLRQKAAELAGKYKVDGVAALYLAYWFGRDGKSGEAYFENVRKVLVHYTPEEVVVVWGFLKNEKMNPKRILKFAASLRKETNLLDFLNLPDVLRFLTYFQMKNLPYYSIITRWAFAKDPKKAEEAFEYVSNLDLPRSVDAGATQIYEYTFGKPYHLKLLQYVFNHGGIFDGDNIANFFKDPALPHCVELVKNGLDEKSALMLGRNFYLKKVPLEKMHSISKSQIDVERIRIFAMRSKVAHVELFGGGRSVVVLKEREIFRGRDRFFDENMEEAIGRAIGELHEGQIYVKCDTGKFNDNAGERAEIGRTFLDQIVNAPPPATFLCECHGGPDGFSQFSITSDKIAKAFAARAEKWGKSGRASELAEDIFIANSCYFHDIIRKVIAKTPGKPHPICVAMAEYGAYGVNGGLQYILRANVSPTIGTLFNVEDKYANSDISVYVDDENGRTMQITEADKAGEDAGKDA